MSYMSAGVEYGLHCLLYLTRSDDVASEASVRDLAELQGVPGEFLAKLFTKLAKAKLLTATEGIKGGFRLARPANQISVHDVIVAIDGEKSLFNCREIRGRCALFTEETPSWATQGVCSIHAVMLAAEQAMRNELKRHTLHDLAHQVAEKTPPAYGERIIQWLSERNENRRGEKRRA
ncbi:rrf2 family protein, putative transcriptional regulator [Serratia sp. FGI94]|uniref:RrF2 family transcriptional regulator n=1 Tax=Serratia sp. FGI94 TaxID=671990 RepID=UPI0002A707CB|nr:Rrf2 family transcriptional regulator [Serratia sp. FGI94]AGB84059.1 rrf2 family protein, putative transcriptional regulator [Serratia sp. FGI94]